MKVIKGFKLANVVLASALALALSGCGSDAAPSTSADNTAAENVVADNTAAENVVADNTAAANIVADNTADENVVAADSTVAVDIDATFEVFGAPNTVVTDSTKGDVIEFTIGAEPSVAGFQSAESVDVSEFADAGALTFDFKLVADADSAAQTVDFFWKVKVESNGGQENGGQSVELVMPGAVPELQAWQNVTLPLSVLESHEIDLQAIDKVMVFPAWGEGAGAVYQLANVALVEQAAESQGEIVEFFEGDKPELSVPEEYRVIIRAPKVSPMAGKKVPTLKASYPQYTSWARITTADTNVMLGHGSVLWYKQRFAAKLGSGSQLPINVSVNSTQFGLEPNGSELWDWYADRRLRINSPVIGPQGVEITRKVPGTSGQFWINYDTTPMPVPPTLMYSKETTEESNWNVTATAGVAVTASVGLPFGLAGGSVEVNLSVAAGGGGSTSVTTSQNYYTPFITIPGRCQAYFHLEERYNDEKEEFKIPMQVQGWVGSNYGIGQYDGHYYWAVSATYFWPEYGNGTEFYTATNERKANHAVGVVAELRSLDDNSLPCPN